MSRPPVRSSRFSLRVHEDTKQQVAELRESLQARGLYASEREILEVLILHAAQLPADEIDALIRHRRSTAP